MKIFGLDINTSLKAKYKWIAIPFALGLIVVFGYLDYITGQEIGLSIFYLIPISFVAWFFGRGFGIFFALVGALTWHTADYYSGQYHSYQSVPLWNTAVRLGFFLIVAINLARLRQSIRDKDKLYEKLQNTYDELKNAQDELEAKAQELSRSNKELEQFSRIAAHDLKAPIIAVEGYVRRLKKKYEHTYDEKAEQYFGYIFDTTSRMQHLIRDLLTYARVGVKAKEFICLDCNDILSRAINNLTSDIEECSAEITHDLLPFIMGDDVQLVQLFQNLIGNSVVKLPAYKAGHLTLPKIIQADSDVSLPSDDTQYISLSLLPLPYLLPCAQNIRLPRIALPIIHSLLPDIP
jgi:signal transduction histidine kinase